MANQTPIYGFPIFDPAGADSAELGLGYFNSLTGNTPTSLTGRLEMILSTLDENKSTIYAKTSTQWNSDTTVLKAGEWGIDTDRGILRLGDGINKWNGLEDYLPALPVLSGGSEPTSATIGALGQFYIHSGATMRLYVCVKATSPYTWVGLAYPEELEDFRRTYDSDDSGIVDDAEKLGGYLPSHYLNATQKAVANGVATLDSNAKIPASQLDLTSVNSAISTVETKASGAQTSADNANAAAVTAQNSANSAKTAADDAKSAADDAKIAADNAQDAAENKISGGYQISIADTAWTQSGNMWVATIADSRIPAETSERFISLLINWHPETISNLAGILAWSTVETPSGGGSYTVRVGSIPDESPEHPDFTMTGEMLILEVKRI